MTFQWTHFYDFSKEAFAHRASFAGCPEEAVFRTIVSRSYYAAFNVALLFMIERNWNPGRGEKHRWLIERFNRYIPPKDLPEDKRQDATNKARLVATKLESLRTKRNECDYDLAIQSFPVDVHAANKAMREAARIFKAIEDLKTVVPR